MNYTQTLALAEAHNINVCMLTIADEVASTFGKTYERYEDVCQAIHNLWLKSDNLSIASLTEALKSKLEHSDADLDNVLDYGEDFDSVIDYACYLGI